MKYRVLITTSGLGSRLGSFTEHTNKCLIRIRRKPVISYVIEAYPKKTEFVVTLGYYGDHVKEFLKIAYPERKFIFVNIDKYQGKGSNLLYSMLKAKKYLQLPFIFHACDTLVYEKVPPPSRNWNAGFRGTNSATYRSFDVVDNLVAKIHDKGIINPDLLHMGLVGVLDYKDFWKEASVIYKRNNNDESLSDAHVLANMIKNGNKFQAIEFKEWNDTGNVQSLYETWNKFDDLTRTMDKAGEFTFFVNGHVVKFFSNEKKLKQRVQRAFLLKKYVPKISVYSKNFLKYKFIKGKVFSESVLPVKFSKFLEWLQHDFWQDTKIEGKTTFINDCKKFYYDKTVERLNSFLKSRHVADTENSINGIEVPKASEMLKKLDYRFLSDGIPSRFHGDLVLDNVVDKGNKFVLLDWRESFSGNLTVGDRYYDLAKLNHNLSVNHDLVNKGLFTIKVRGKDIFCDILRSDRLVECQNIFFSFVNKHNYDLRKIKILTSLVWLNMSPLHQHPFDLFLFYFGKYNLWRTLNEAG